MTRSFALAIAFGLFGSLPTTSSAQLYDLACPMTVPGFTDGKLWTVNGETWPVEEVGTTTMWGFDPFFFRRKRPTQQASHVWYSPWPVTIDLDGPSKIKWANAGVLIFCYHEFIPPSTNFYYGDQMDYEGYAIRVHDLAPDDEDEESYDEWLDDGPNYYGTAGLEDIEECFPIWASLIGEETGHVYESFPTGWKVCFQNGNMT